MAPISSGSSTWTSSGIPFSFVSMATGIGPSSSGSQATVASVLTSTLLAGLGFSGGVISSFPSSVWQSRAPTHNPTTAQQTAGPTEHSKTIPATAKDNGEAGGEDKNSNSQGEDGERKEEEEEEEKDDEEEKDEKGRKGSGTVTAAERKDNSTVVNESPRETPDATAKVKNQTGSDPTNTLYGVEDQLQYAHNPLGSNTTTTNTEATNERAALPAPTDPAATLRPRKGGHKKHWPFSIHTGESTKAPKPHVNSALVLYNKRGWIL